MTKRILIDHDKVLQLIKEGKTLKEVASSCNVQEKSIQLFLFRNGTSFPKLTPLVKVKKNTSKKVKHKTKAKKYWSEVQEQLVIDYINQPDNRSRIYNKLRTALRTMVESILLRYFNTFLHYTDSVENLINDAEIDISSKLLKFKPTKGKKAYSYFGTIIKHYYFDYFKRASSDKIIIDSIYDNNNELVHDVVDLPDESPAVDELKQRVIEKLNKVRTNDETLIKVIDCLKRLMAENDLNRYYCCYVLLKDTGLSTGTIRKKLIELDFKESLALKKSLVNLEKIKNKYNEHDAKDAFKKFYEYKSEKEKTFKIQEKRTRTRRPKAIIVGIR